VTVDPAAAVARTRSHSSLRETVLQTLSMASRALKKMRRNPEQFFDVSIQPLLFTAMFAYIFGGAIAGSVADYLPYLLPGILVQTVITTSVVTGVQLREDMEKGVFDRFRSLPIARVAPLAGALLADTLRYAIATTLTFLTGFIMGYRPDAGFPGMLMAGLLVIGASWALSWIFAFFGVIARTAASVQGISFLILFPLTFLSNAYVPIDTLPPALAWFASINPVSHLVSAARALTMGTDAGADVIATIIGAAVVVAVFAPLTVRAYMRRA
jgi:ABC-2 type transport system permease protein